MSETLIGITTRKKMVTIPLSLIEIPIATNTLIILGITLYIR